MKYIEPINQMKLFGLDKSILEMIKLFKNNKLPNKILLSGQKGIGKSTLSYHFINYVLSIDEENSYDVDNFTINSKNRTFITVLNKSNPNFNLIDIDEEKKFIDINQVRKLINVLGHSSFNKKPRFVLIDNIEYLNTSSINALLKILEEPPSNIYFILINNNKRILSTLLSRCINFKISLSNKESLEVANKLLDQKSDKYLNKDLVNYYMTPGNIYNLAYFGVRNDLDLINCNLENLLKKMIDNNYYKNDNSIKVMIFDLIEYYFNRINIAFSPELHNTYSFFLKKINDTKKFNLDEESLFSEFRYGILNG